VKKVPVGENFGGKKFSNIISKKFAITGHFKNF
jgi:hypothetical protein